MVQPSKVATVQTLWPLLAVDDVDASAAFWCDQLGFTVADDARSGRKRFWCRLERGGASVMLQSADAREDGPPRVRGRGVTFYFVCDDVDALFEEFSARGLRLQPPSEAYYGMRQMFVPDPDGYIVCFETPVAD